MLERAEVTRSESEAIGLEVESTRGRTKAILASEKEHSKAAKPRSLR